LREFQNDDTHPHKKRENIASLDDDAQTYEDSNKHTTKSCLVPLTYCSSKGAICLCGVFTGVWWCQIRGDKRKQ